MRTHIAAALLGSALCLPVAAQTASPEASTAATPEHSLTANVGLFSSYRFRGIDQSFGKPALQGGFDYAHASGFYAGNWNSNVSSGAGFPDGNLEMDVYAGYKTALGDSGFGLDVGAIVYYYPGSEGKVLGTGARSGAVSNKELYLGTTWKFLSLKYFYSVDDYFALRGWDAAGASTGKSTKGSGDLDLSASYDLGDGWGINAHVGRLSLKNGYKGDYTDWKVGVTKDIGGWVFAASYIDTNAAGSCSGASTYQFYCFTNKNAASASDTLETGAHAKDAGRGIAVVSLSRTF